MARPLYLHFGPHKTGTTSIQRYLQVNRAALKRQGVSAFRNIRLGPDGLQEEGAAKSTNCFQLAHMILRPDLDTLARRHGRAALRPTRKEAKVLLAQVNRLLHACEGDAVVVSFEAFSFLRTRGERALLDLMTDGFSLRPIGFFRSKEAWMTSWRRHVSRRASPKVIAAAAGQDSIFNCESDSWLLDHDAIRAFFGPHGTYLSYDDAVAKDGSVIPQFLAALDVDPAQLPEANRIWLNDTAAKLDTPTA